MPQKVSLYYNNKKIIHFPRPPNPIAYPRYQYFFIVNKQICYPSAGQ